MLTLFAFIPASLQAVLSDKRNFFFPFVLFFFYNRETKKTLLRLAVVKLIRSREQVILWRSRRNQQLVHGREGERRSARIPNDSCFLVHLARWRSMQRSQRFTPRCDVRISHPSSPEARFRAQRLYERDARQVERKIKRAPFSPRAPQRYYPVMWILSFLRDFHESRTRSRRIKSSFIMSRASARALQIAAPNWTMRKIHFKALYSSVSFRKVEKGKCFPQKRVGMWKQFWG